MENIEEFNVTDTMLWEKVKEGLTKKWLENEADTSDIDYLVEVYNETYDGGIFNCLEDAVYDAFSDVWDAFDCGVNSQGNYDSYDDWFKVESYDNMLYSWNDSSMLDKIVDEMSNDIRYLAQEIDDNKVDSDNTYRDIVKDITLTQKHYIKTLENINTEVFKYIDENKQKCYDVANLKENLIGFQEKCNKIEVIPESDKLVELIDQRNTKIQELLHGNSAFLKGALYNYAIEKQISCLDGNLGEIYYIYNINDEFRETHKEEFDEVNENFAKIGEFIQ